MGQRQIACIFLSLASGIFGMPALSHEFWIAPTSYLADETTQIDAELLVGMDMVGSAQIHIKNEIKQSFRQLADQRKPNKGRLGDRPALQTMALGSGLHVLAHVTKQQSTSYKDLQKFQAFLEEKDLLAYLQEHRDRNLPEKDFAEGYVRHAKSLLVRGSAMGGDQILGLRLELVAMNNPYVMTLPNNIPILALEHGKPVANRRMTIQSRRPDGVTDRAFAMTNDQGLANIMLYPDREYLIDLVTMEQSDPATDPHQAPWRSHWASLTFQTPTKALAQ
ncbi:MAG TPA: hypothetical protein DHV03_07645 [Alphaproteobacteria bacterium]|nr:MAG: DUF4198 domain-containing protein [SAR116 cluster bacterium]HCY48543.1 hypothetical protein [Alphaproteobacteria bacterium]|tara:strand:+ start:853 stop:1686 length:834 start_codon:yes stop_codon:yes gene_type:complete